MNNYTESRKHIDAIRQKYSCAGEVLFRTSIQLIVEYGQESFKDDSWVSKQMAEVDERHNKADAESKYLFVTRDFEKGILECAEELAEIEIYDLLIYIQREVWLGGGGVGEPDYQRAISLLKRTIENIDEHHETCREVLEELYSCGFHDDEINHLGFGYILDVEEDEE